VIDVEVTNFQSIEKASFKVSGFTALSGPSNIGKSALVRAIKCALTNARGTYFVRHGDTCLRRVKGVKTCKCHSTVHLKTDGLEILWEKGDAINRTTVNGVVHDKPEGTEFLQVHGLAPMKVGQDLELLQVGDQFDKVFLLSESGPAVAELVSDVGQLADINDAIRMAEKDRKDTASLRKVREKDVEDLGVQLEAYLGLDALGDRFSEVDRLRQAAEVKEDQAAKLSRYIERVAKMGAAVQSLAGIDKVEVPSIDELAPRTEKFTTIIRLLGQLSVKVPAFKQLDGVDKIPIPEIEVVSKLSSTFGSICRWVSALTASQQRSAALESVEKMSVPSLEALLGICGKAQTLSGWVTRLRTLSTEVAAIEGSIKDLTEEETQIYQESDELGVCPTCIQPVNARLVHRHIGEVH
jgi:energy-coupling factor transporter ATP-binding protein EcfA2